MSYIPPTLRTPFTNTPFTDTAMMARCRARAERGAIVSNCVRKCVFVKCVSKGVLEGAFKGVFQLYS